MRGSKLAITSTFLVCLPMMTTVAWAGSGEPLIRTLKEPAELITRENGEIRIPQPVPWTATDGTIYPVSVEFSDRAHYVAILETGKESIAIEDLVALVVRTVDGVVTFSATDIQQGILHELPSLATGPLCGGVAARGVAKVAEDGFVVVSFHDKIFQGNHFGDDTNPWSCTASCAGDIFSECDSFAMGGCGGPGCVNACKDADTCEVTVFHLSCIVYPIPFGLDLCICG